ncbi:MAG: urate hydroxylase PuuD [Alphaproteobacteria bacterium]|nr:urate hydroxylase PuuD [Alphaproteobacteria bacterium]
MTELLPYFFDWLNLLLRWSHVIVGIAWIGASFYFVWLDDHLEPPSPALRDQGGSGELWAVHGGGFYNPQKYLLAPKSLPQNLHWFYWEAYSTFLTGFALFVFTYLINPSGFLIDAQVAQLSPTMAIIAALAFLVVGWLVYDGICRVFGQKPNGDRSVAALVAVYVVAASYLACNIFAGRAAFLIIGAMLGTIMAANVFFWIIPGQRKVVAILRSGGTPPAIHGQIGKQRSVHNTYLTLPVLFAMLSNHFTMVSNGRWNWLMLLLMMLGGALVRLYFVERHKGRGNLAWPVLAVILFVATAVLAAPKNILALRESKKLSLVADIQPIINERCLACHNGPEAPKQLDFTNISITRANAQQIYQQVYVQKAMPQNNATQITDEERAKFGNWYEQGAKE